MQWVSFKACLLHVLGILFKFSSMAMTFAISKQENPDSCMIFLYFYMFKNAVQEAAQELYIAKQQTQEKYKI